MCPLLLPLWPQLTEVGREGPPAGPALFSSPRKCRWDVDTGRSLLSLDLGWSRGSIGCSQGGTCVAPDGPVQGDESKDTGAQGKPGRGPSSQHRNSLPEIHRVTPVSLSPAVCVCRLHPKTSSPSYSSVKEITKPGQGQGRHAEIKLDAPPPRHIPLDPLRASQALSPVSCENGPSNASVSLCLRFLLWKMGGGGVLHQTAGVLCFHGCC